MFRIFAISASTLVCVWMSVLAAGLAAHDILYFHGIVFAVFVLLTPSEWIRKGRRSGVRALALCLVVGAHLCASSFLAGKPFWIGLLVGGAELAIVGVAYLVHGFFRRRFGRDSFMAYRHPQYGTVMLDPEGKTLNEVNRQIQKGRQRAF